MADTIKIGNTDISAFKVGSGDCKVYLGDTLLYPQSPTPVFEWKYKLTLSDSSTVSAECDGTSAVTSGEVASQYSGSVVSAEIGCVTSIGDSAFRNCSGLTSCTIGSGVTSIGGSAFNSCSSLTSIDIPNSVTSIGDSAFYSCKSLTSVTIGNGVTSIGRVAFTSNVNKLVVTVFPSTPPTITSNFSRPFTRNYVTIYVPSELVDTYKADANWSYYASKIQPIPNS